MNERAEVENRNRAAILALPVHTLVRLGWEVRPGVVQGGIFYRIGDGLGPTGRDTSPADVLRREVQRSHMPNERQHWGIQVLAYPAADGVSPPQPDAILDEVREVVLDGLR